MRENKASTSHQVSKQGVSLTEEYSGPLPVSSEFEKYENILPGAADRILTMAEKEQTSNLIRITQAQNNDIVLKYIGMFMAFAFAMSGMYVAKCALDNNQEWAAVLIGALGIGSIVTNFLKKI